MKNGKPVKLEIIEPTNQGCQLSCFNVTGEGRCCGSIFKSVSFFETGFIFSNSTVFAFLTITNYMNIFSNLNWWEQGMMGREKRGRLSPSLSSFPPHPARHWGEKVRDDCGQVRPKIGLFQVNFLLSWSSFFYTLC